MPQIVLPGADAPTDCSFDDLARWDAVVRDGDAETRELAAEAELAPKTRRGRASGRTAAKPRPTTPPTFTDNSDAPGSGDDKE